MDKRFIENIQSWNQGLELIEKLVSVSYQKRNSKKIEHGFVAQEVKEIYSSLINEDYNGVQSVDKDKLIVVLVNAVQELSKEIKELKSKKKK